MTLTIEVAPEVERAIEAEAERRGVPMATLAAEVLGAWAKENSNGHTGETNLTARQRAVRDGFGKFAGRGQTVDDFLREKHEEAAREMQADEVRIQAAKARGSKAIDEAPL